VVPSRRPVLALALALTLAALALLGLTYARPAPGTTAPTTLPATPGHTTPPTVAPTASPTRPSTVLPTPPPAPALDVGVTARDGLLTFDLIGHAPPDADEALVWLDTAAGREMRRVPLAAGAPISATVTLSATEVITAGAVGPDAALDYWVALPGDEPLRRSGTLRLPPEIAAVGQAAPITPSLTVTWTERLTPHFRLYAPPGSDGERDMDRLAEIAEAGYAQAAAVLSPTEPLSVAVYLTPRVFWQGGVAYGRDGPLIISYLDRNYAGVETWSYFVHEVTHAIGAALLPEGAEVGGVLGEGVAVLATGGHYSREPIDARAATIVANGEYIPLCRLRYDFYAAQHETAYTQSASFVQYLIRTYGLDTFLALYRNQQPQRGSEQSLEQFCEADDARLAAPTGKTNAQLEREWLAALAGVQPSDAESRGWELTVRLYDTMRRYQELLDPPARILPPPPKDWTNDDAFRALVPASGGRAGALETMLVATSEALRAGDVTRAEMLLDSIAATLDAGGAPADDLARSHHAIAQLLEAQARALRLGDEEALTRTLADPAFAARLPFTTRDLLHDLRFAPVRLDVRGTTADGVVEVRGRSLDGRVLDGALYRVRFERDGDTWRLASWASYSHEIALPPGPAAQQWVQ
jgi:hypothetical protein